jgi:hypothetical protein
VAPVRGSKGAISGDRSTQAHGRLHGAVEGLGADVQGPVGGGLEGVAQRAPVLKQPEGLRPIGPLCGIDRGPDESGRGGLFAIDPG